MISGGCKYRLFCSNPMISNSYLLSVVVGLRDWVIGKAGIKKRLQIIFLWYLLSLMVETRKHSLSSASVLSGLNKSQFSKFLKKNRKTVAYTLDSLSKKQAKILAKALKELTGLLIGGHNN
ncbi:MAG: hypothetical protein GY754_07935 [bacterium]|nr:hypothetical protein [bacterium]